MKRLPVYCATRHVTRNAILAVAMFVLPVVLATGDGGTAAGRLVYIPNAADGTISAIDAGSGGTLWVGGADPDRFWLGKMSIVNTDSRTVETVVAPGVGSAAHVSFTPDGAEVWVASVTTNVVWTVDSATGELTSAVPLIAGGTRGASTPEGEAGLIGLNEVAISPNGNAAFAVGPESATIFRIDVASREVTAQRRGEPRAHGVAVSPDGGEVWVANRSGSLSVFDSDSLEPHEIAVYSGSRVD